MLCYYLFRNRKIDTLFIIFGIVVAINCFGRYLVAISNNLETAILANKLIYVGGCYAPLMLLLVAARLSNYKIPKVLEQFLVLLSTVVFGLTLTIGSYGIYYKDVQLGYVNGYHYLIKEYGPAHKVYPVLLIFYMISLALILMFAIKNRNKISVYTIVVLAIIGIVVMLTYILQRVFKSTIDYISFGYLIAIAIVIRLFERLSKFDMDANVAHAVDKLGKSGYLIFDDRYRYVGANTFIRQLFPEIENEWIMDATVPKKQTYLYREIVEWLMSGDGQAKTIIVGEQFFEVTISDIVYGKKKCVGYFLEFNDRTDEKNYLNEVEKEVQIKTADIFRIKEMMVLGMASMVESRDNSTGGHIKRTSRVVKIFAEQIMEHKAEFGLSEQFLQLVERAAPMHDLGKIAIDDVILRKQGKYTAEEFAAMQKHSEEGAKIVENILREVEDDTFVDVAVNVAHYHHEKWNGAGYPDHLAGEAIPVEARIMALADVFDALVSKRCYKRAFSYDEAFEIIEESLGSHFDPRFGKVFIECRKELEQFYDEEGKE